MKKDIKITSIITSTKAPCRLERWYHSYSVEKLENSKRSGFVSFHFGTNELIKNSPGPVTESDIIRIGQFVNELINQGKINPLYDTPERKSESEKSTQRSVIDQIAMFVRM